MKFKKGDIIQCINTGRAGFPMGNSASLTIGTLYTVLEVYEDIVYLRGDSGFRIGRYASRFILAKETSKFAAVELKIKQMDAKRKALGYKW